VIAQDRKFGAGRIIFRQQRNLFEQFRTGGVIKIFWRQPFRMLRQTIDHLAGKRRGLLVETMRLGQSGGMHIHNSLLHALSGAVEL